MPPRWTHWNRLPAKNRVSPGETPGTLTSLDDGEGGGGDRVAMLLAVWRIEEGAAAAVLHREDRELLRTLIGLSAWPKLDQRSEVWYGE